ncbi:hypothetical protein JCM8097_006528 [Rhodosporidiobolus ruineniae]
MKITQLFCVLAGLAAFFSPVQAQELTDSDLLNNVLDVLATLGQWALVCPIKCGKMVLSSAVCDLHILGLDVDGVLECHCKRFASSWNGCTECLNEDDMSLDETRAEMIREAQWLHDTCIEHGYDTIETLYSTEVDIATATTIDEVAVSSAAASLEEAAQELSTLTITAAPTSSSSSSTSSSSAFSTSYTYGDCPDGERWQVIFNKCMVNNPATVVDSSASSAASESSSSALARLTSSAAGSASAATSTAAAGLIGTDAAAAAQADTTTSGAGAGRSFGEAVVWLLVAAGIAALA